MQTSLATPLRFSVVSACLPSPHKLRRRPNRVLERASTGAHFATLFGLQSNRRLSAADKTVGVLRWTRCDLRRRRNRLGFQCRAAGDNGAGE
eukprot:CAMPEP_0118934110 /NCGR_PEP_ID=MMETSP1169-20130426/13646_1 /TAXON_ID=36882 /ORGANISM="Pyramimonas obovata, Strain CCMP722" /LENGTH=91 /DNA_ID=CAMNT_0006876981 /DNA_START=103 /DNA_END=375 /DNA_ORIENTATION=+